MRIYILLTTPSTDAGPFNIYSDVDGFYAPFGFNVSKATLEAGYAVDAPDGTTIVRLISVGECTNQVEFPIYENCTTENVYLNLSNGSIYSYNPTDETYQFLTGLFPATDLAMTSSKLFIYQPLAKIVYEYDITIDPWSISLSRAIDFFSIPGGAGLETVSNTKLLFGGNSIYEVDISGSSPVFNILFDLPGSVAGDIYYSVYKNLIYVTYNVGGNFTIGEFTYNGQLIKSSILTPFKFPYGLYSYNDDLFVINSDGTIYLIDPNTLSPTFHSQITLPSNVNGAAQPVTCRH